MNEMTREDIATWLTEKFVNHDQGDDTDEWALDNGYVSVVPGAVRPDRSSRHFIFFKRTGICIKHIRKAIPADP